MTVVFWAVIWLAISFAMLEAGRQMRAKAPIYEERITNLGDRVGAFLSAHGVQSTKYSIRNLYSHERIFEFVRGELSNVIGFFSDRLLIFLRGLGFLIEMAQLDSAISGLLARKLVLGWKPALLVGGGLVCTHTQMIGDYVINPKLMKKELRVSFLDEIMLSLLIWSHLLGPAGALLAMPTNFSGPKFHGETFYGRGWCVDGGTGLIGGQ